MHNGDHRDHIRFHGKEDQIWKTIEIGESNRKHVDRERLRTSGNVVKPLVDLATKSITERG